MPGRLAGFPMYDFAGLAAANDAVWQVIADRLRTAGITDVPAALSRDLTVDQLWLSPDLLLAQSCGYPLLTTLQDKVRIVATPRYRASGCDGAYHGSAIIVRGDDRSRDLAALRGRRCAANQPHSNTGMNLLRAAVAPLADGRPFFGSVAWSGSHRASLAMVARGEADVAAIDAVTLAHVTRVEPELVGQIRILAWTPRTGGLPFVTARTTDDAVLDLLRAALFEIGTADEHAPLRDALLLDGFALLSENDYQPVMDLERDAIRQGYPVLA